MFVGREKELKQIRELLKRDCCFIIVYGVRRVGKSTLISEALKSSSDKTVIIEAKSENLRSNLNRFIGACHKAGIFPKAVRPESFEDAFDYINSLEGSYNIVIDEYPRLKYNTNPSTENVDEIFQEIIDQHSKNIRLIISGSHVTMMKELIQHSNPLFGRHDLKVELKPLTYKECVAFYPNYTPYERVTMYSVFGGSPFTNSQIDPSLTPLENIINKAVSPNSPIASYPHEILLDIISKKNVEWILSLIGNGKTSYTDIETKLGKKDNGGLAPQLKRLEQMGIISKVKPINATIKEKKTRYEISDNFLRFYYTYLYEGNTEDLSDEEQYFKDNIASSFVTFVSHRFEQICRTYFRIQKSKGLLEGVTGVGYWYYDDPANKKNGEFDIALKREDGMDLYEAKFYKGPVSKKMINDESMQVDSIPGVRICNRGFISLNGFEPDCEGIPNLITGEDLYRD